MSIQLNYTFAVPANLQTFSEPTPCKGFGEYQDFSPSNFIGYHTAQKTSAFAIYSLLGVSAVAVISATIGFSLPVVIIPVALIGLALVGVRTYLKYKASLTCFPPDLTQGLNPEDFQGKRVGEHIQENGSALVLKDAVESTKYKLDLIRNAQASIFMSAYMGEESFDTALDLIKERMEQKRDLKVFILGSDHFITPENQKRIDALKALHPQRFYCVLNPEIYYSEHPSGGSPRLSTNHIKLMSIDQGAYTISGGCALRPFWTDISGEDHLEKLKTGLFDFYNPLEAKGFRDMDFLVKSSPGGAGMTSYLEGAKLMLRYAHMQDPALATELKNQFIQLMRAPAAATAVPSVDNNPDKVDGFGAKIYSTGPDHTRNSYLHALIDLVNNAQNKIVIAHMFFHPPQELIDALIQASERGVKIEIITNSKDKEAPLAHRFFSDLGQTKYAQLFQGPGKENVNVYEYYRANTTYHKKVVIVDDQYTAFGSSNFGFKCLDENAADYEFNSVIDSGAFAEQTMRVLEKDIALSERVDPEVAANPSLETRTFAWLQERVMTPIL